MHDKNIDEQGFLFGKWQVRPDTWVITNRWQNFMYLLIGEKKALLIDTGYGEGNLRAFVEQITNKPVMVLNTHGHFDHTGGNAWWPEAWMTEESAKSARTTFAPVHDEWFSEKPYRDYQTHFVRDGDKFDLGNRVVEMISIPAHHEGSVAVLDKNARLLFTGDELESGQVLLFVRDRDMHIREAAAAHKRNMERLKARRIEFDALCPAHNGLFLDPDVYLDDFIALDEKLSQGTAEIMPDTAGFGFPAYTAGTFWERFGPLERVQYGQASIVYRKEQE